MAHFPIDEVNPPIIQGQFMTTANALVAIERAAANTDDARYDAAAERALAWIASHEPETTQDKIFKIIALMHYGTPDQKRSAWSVVEILATEQQADGGWKENAATDGSNAFATGQVLYAFKQAGISIHGAMFRRGVDFLLQTQVNDPSSGKRVVEAHSYPEQAAVQLRPDDVGGHRSGRRVRARPDGRTADRQAAGRQAAVTQSRDRARRVRLDEHQARRRPRAGRRRSTCSSRSSRRCRRT